MRLAGSAPLHARESVPRKKVLVLLFLSILAVAACLFFRPSTLQLTLEISSSARATAQLLYDLGHGYNSTDYDVFQVTSTSLNSFEEIAFDLPPKTVLPGHFVLLPPPARFKIRNIAIRNSGLVLLRVPPEDVLPLLVTVTRVQTGNTLLFTSLPTATFDNLEFKFRGPLRLKRRIFFQNLQLLLIATGLLCLIAILVLWPPRVLIAPARVFAATFRRIHSFFTLVARRLSSPEFIAFDSYAIWFYAICLALFLAGSLAGLNGSSIAAFSSIKGHGAVQKVWLGAPRNTRSDEWGYSTPDILNQRLRSDRFEVSHSALGGHSVALLGNIPVRHFTTIFRPQYWAFFFLPLDYAFAVYWQCKALILLTGLFTWLLLITRSTFWAVTGALWYFFSPFTQWTYSWPTGFPEMVGLICFTIVFTCYLTVGSNKLGLFFCALLVSACAINFALCAYLPHMLTLIWLALFFCVAWFIGARRAIFTRQNLGPRVLAAAVAVCLVAIVGLLLFIQLRPALVAIAATVYPGTRVFPPATASPFLFASHFMQWTETEKHFPPALGNMSEGSGFLWIAPAALFCLRRMTLTRIQKSVLAALSAFSLLLLAWWLLPLPPVIGSIFALNRTDAPRGFTGLGLANVSIVALTAASLRRVSAFPYYLYAPALAFIVMFFFLRHTNDRLDFFFTTGQVMFAALFAAALITLLVTGQRLALALALVVPQALVFGTVNPLERGLVTITASPLFQFVRERPALLRGKWIVFSPSETSSGFFAASGCDVYTGMHYLPDIDHFPLFAAHGIDPQTLNALGYLLARPLPPNEKMSFELRPPVLAWNVSPTDAILPQLGIKYVAFDEPPPPALIPNLIPLSPQPIDGFWLYRFP